LAASETLIEFPDSSFVFFAAAVAGVIAHAGYCFEQRRAFLVINL